MKKVRKARAEAFHEINRAAKEDNEAERLSSLVHFQRPPEPEFLDVEPDPEPSSPPPPPRPVLLDVTPRALGIATVGGYCEEIIKRNCQVPLEQTRVFTTGHDDQKSVEIRVCQGESRRFEDNTQVGTLVLPDLPPRPRGLLRIAVTFEIDTDGILNVSARDEQTLQAQSARINLIGAQSSEEVEAARERLRQMRGG
ncbi:MAG: Hsp70 family protein [Deltaproteobacteria bacterium]|nr:Hsp70 family protein [Deltaproteobacteria bacterium]